MTTPPRHDPAGGGDGTRSEASEALDPSLALGAVREDIRQTLRMGWVDPSLDAVAAYPVFFTAAWSAMRPNVGRSFMLLARSVRAEAVEAVRQSAEVPDLRKRMAKKLAEEELARIDECVKAAHLSMAKMQIVVHGFSRAVRRDRLRGTGREEPPIRRGVPDWQRWMSFQPASDGAQSVLEQVAPAFGLPAPPAPLRLLARWPTALEAAWHELAPLHRSRGWSHGTARLRRAVLRGIETLPHPIDLQWTALKARGFVESERPELVDMLVAHDSAMPSQTLAAAFLWAAFGAPEIGAEG